MRPFHPLFFAAYPVLSLYAANTVLIPFAEVWRPLLVVVGLTALLWGILRLVLRNGDRAAVGASVAVIGLFAFGPLRDVVQHTPWGHDLASSDLFGAWVAGWVVCVVLACLKWRRLPKITSGLNATSVVLALLPVFSIAMAWMQGGRDASVATASGKSRQFRGTRPDIFYIILDGYGRSDVLRRELGFDNSEFVDGLRKRGFFVADRSHSNYCQTELSLSSALNMGYLQDVVKGFSPDEQKRSVLDKLIDQSALSRTLREYGYGYVGVTSGFPGVHPQSADLVIDGPNGSSLFESALLARTPIENVSAEGVMSAYVMRRENLISAVGTVGRLGMPVSRPRFVFAHILAPHPPFVLGPNGEQETPHRMYALVDGSHFMQNGGTPEEYAKGYSGQAQAIGKLVLSAVDEILKHAHTPPIIVIQGDHGPKMRLDQEELARTDVTEVFPILNAYYVPDPIRKQLYPGITPVNSFRTILRAQFGEDLPNLKDRSWYSSWTWPFHFEEVTTRLEAAGVATPVRHPGAGEAPAATTLQVPKASEQNPAARAGDQGSGVGESR